jgi:hypothetical protein
MDVLGVGWGEGGERFGNYWKWYFRTNWMGKLQPEVDTQVPGHTWTPKLKLTHKAMLHHCRSATASADLCKHQACWTQVRKNKDTRNKSGFEKKRPFTQHLLRCSRKPLEKKRSPCPRPKMTPTGTKKKTQKVRPLKTNQKKKSRAFRPVFHGFLGVQFLDRVRTKTKKTDRRHRPQGLYNIYI